MTSIFHDRRFVGEGELSGRKQPATATKQPPARPAHPGLVNRAPTAVAKARCPGLVPTSTERAGSTPRWWQKASTRPGRGGRHQQVGGPPGCGQLATAAPGSATSSGTCQPNTRCGTDGSSTWKPGTASAATNPPAAPEAGSRRNGTRSTATNPSSSVGDSNCRTARSCEVGAISPG